MDNSFFVDPNSLAGLVLPGHLLGLTFSAVDLAAIRAVRPLLVSQIGIAKTAEVSTPAFLAAVFVLGRAFATKNATKTSWAMKDDLAAMLDLPWKIVLSKAASLKRAGLLSGCTCGCRGDFEMTADGEATLFAAA